MLVLLLLAVTGHGQLLDDDPGAEAADDPSSSGGALPSLNNSHWDFEQNIASLPIKPGDAPETGPLASLPASLAIESSAQRATPFSYPPQEASQEASQQVWWDRRPLRTTTASWTLSGSS